MMIEEYTYKSIQWIIQSMRRLWIEVCITKKSAATVRRRLDCIGYVAGSSLDLPKYFFISASAAALWDSIPPFMVSSTDL